MNWSFLLSQLLRRPLGAASLALLLALYLAALLADFLAPYPTNQNQLRSTFHPPSALLFKNGRLHARLYRLADQAAARWEPDGDRTVPLSFFAPGHDYRLLGLFPANLHLFRPDSDDPGVRVYLLGSDSTGRDVFSRLLSGSRISLTMGLIGISITITLGFIVGGLAGYFGGAFDFLSMRLVEFLMAIPGLYLLLALRSALAPYFSSDRMFLVIIIILALIGWSGTARVIRGLSLSLRRRPYVEAAEALGLSSPRILFRHLLPNLASYLLVAATLSIPGYILGEAALSFLGLGIQEPASSWGLMLSQAQDMKVFMLNFWWLLSPGAAIFLTVLAFNVLGDCLRDIVDPKFSLNRRT